MRGLAKSIGYSPGTIYLHFKDKQELLYCLVEESFEKLHAALQRISGRTGSLSLIKKQLRVYVDFGLQYPHHYHFAFMIRSTNDSRFNSSVPHPAFDELRRTVRDCVEQKVFRRVDPETTCQALWACVHGITSLLIMKSDFPWTDTDKVINHVIDIAVDGLRAR